MCVEPMTLIVNALLATHTHTHTHTHTAMHSRTGFSDVSNCFQMHLHACTVSRKSDVESGSLRGREHNPNRHVF